MKIQKFEVIRFTPKMIRVCQFDGMLFLRFAKNLERHFHKFRLENSTNLKVKRFGVIVSFS